MHSDSDTDVDPDIKCDWLFENMDEYYETNDKKKKRNTISLILKLIRLNINNNINNNIIFNKVEDFFEKCARENYIIHVDTVSDTTENIIEIIDDYNTLVKEELRIKFIN
jgi:vacuolar-type H+-ATPase catalytic subunit A/Vma1